MQQPLYNNFPQSVLANIINYDKPLVLITGHGGIKSFTILHISRCRISKIDSWNIEIYKIINTVIEYARSDLAHVDNVSLVYG